MTVTVKSFRCDFPEEFGNKSNYPDMAIRYWLAIAQILMGLNPGAMPEVAAFTGTFTRNKTVSVTNITFGSLTLFPLLLTLTTGEDLPALPVGAAILSQIDGVQGGVGTYQTDFYSDLADAQCIALKPVRGGENPFWGASSVLPSSPPTTLADFATEMWVAHQLVLEKQAVDAARTGGDPGTKIGIISSKSVNGVSVGFDIGSITGGKMQADAGYYNQTIYGIRFYRLMKIRGSGPIQIGIGQSPPFLFFQNDGLLGSGNAWAGPWPGIEQGATGFGN